MPPLRSASATTAIEPAPPPPAKLPPMKNAPPPPTPERGPLDSDKASSSLTEGDDDLIQAGIPRPMGPAEVTAFYASSPPPPLIQLQPLQGRLTVTAALGGECLTILAVEGGRKIGDLRQDLIFGEDRTTPGGLPVLINKNGTILHDDDVVETINDLRTLPTLSTTGARKIYTLVYEPPDIFIAHALGGLTLPRDLWK